MSKKLKLICIFIGFPIVMMAALFLSLYIGEKTKYIFRYRISLR